jgi:hypothetical protein
MFNRTTVAIVATCLLCGVCAQASEALLVRNDTPYVQTLWQYPETRMAYLRPPHRLDPGESKIVHFDSGVKYYIVFKDENGRETPVGWKNVTAILQRDPSYTLRIGTVIYSVCRYVREQRWCNDESYTICRPVWETVERNVIFWETTKPCCCPCPSPCH